MGSRKQIKKVAIFGYFGAGNLGDEAVVSVLIQKIKTHYPNVEIIGICLNPEIAHQQHGIAAFPIRRMKGKNGIIHNDNTQQSLLKKIARRMSILVPKEIIFLFQSYKRLKGCDAVIVGGSGQLVDNEGGSLNHPYNHFKWSVLARLVGARFMFLSVGAGPLLTKTGRWFIKQSLLMSSYHSFRDMYSKNLVESFGVKKNNVVYPDQAFAFNFTPQQMQQKNGIKKLVVGVAPIAYCDSRHWPHINNSQYRNYVEKMAQFTAWLIETNHYVLFFHTQVHGDDRVISDIQKALIGKTNNNNIFENISEHPVQWYTDAFDVIAKTDFVVASRFHAIIFSYVMNRPAIGISYDRKINNVMASVGQSEYVLPIDSFAVNQLIEKFTTMKTQYQKSKTRIHTTIEHYKVQLEQQYEYVLQ